MLITSLRFYLTSMEITFILHGKRQLRSVSSRAGKRKGSWDGPFEAAGLNPRDFRVNTQRANVTGEMYGSQALSDFFGPPA